MMVSRRNTVIVMIIVAILAVGAGLYTPRLFKNDAKNYGDVSIQEAVELLEQKPDLVVLDVRTVGEFEDGHIEDAINIPVDELANRLDKLSKNSELLVYCRTGNRSLTAVRVLNNGGFAKIYHMYEGISVWIQQGYPIVQ